MGQTARDSMVMNKIATIIQIQVKTNQAPQKSESVAC